MTTQRIDCCHHSRHCSSRHRRRNINQSWETASMIFRVSTWSSGKVEVFTVSNDHKACEVSITATDYENYSQLLKNYQHSRLLMFFMILFRSKLTFKFCKNQSEFVLVLGVNNSKSLNSVDRSAFSEWIHCHRNKQLRTFEILRWWKSCILYILPRNKGKFDIKVDLWPKGST
jgi:hypothetical protein